MIKLSRKFSLTIAATLVALALTSCAMPLPRQDDPYEKFNRKMFTFNNKLDDIAIRPVAVGYRKITSEGLRQAIRNFFANVHSPITIVNDLLQGRPRPAVIASGRLVVNSTVGFLGFFDPATRWGMREDTTDFGVTFARWGVPEGPYLMLPFVGPTGLRDLAGNSLDSYYLDPLIWFERTKHYTYYQEYYPSLLNAIATREALIDSEHLADGVYDTYVFVRDAYRQQRIDQIYHGNPPEEVIRAMQGLNDTDADKMLEQLEQYKKNHPPSGR